MVESNAAAATALALRLHAKHRWCITGTPIQRKLDDLYGLLRFLQASPFDVVRWWTEVICEPYEVRYIWCLFFLLRLTEFSTYWNRDWCSEWLGIYLSSLCGLNFSFMIGLNFFENVTSKLVHALCTWILILFIKYIISTASSVIWKVSKFCDFSWISLGCLCS